MLFLSIGLLGLLAGTARVPVPEAGPGFSKGWQLDLGRTEVAELQLLPGIGPVLARRIVMGRTQGRIKSDLEGLIAIKGIGPRTIERLRPLIAGGVCSEPGLFTSAD